MRRGAAHRIEVRRGVRDHDQVEGRQLREL
jgi:hypothetical protein